MQGIIAVNKERGFTSFDVVAKLRGILKTKKIGHTGTLDPQAEGVLVLCVGKATKLVDTLINHDKIYKAQLILGSTTDTYDAWGQVLEERKVDVDEDMIRTSMASFIGLQSQLPPMYSAKKVDGKKLYELAREGRTVERKPSAIEIYDITVTDISLPRVDFTVSCSKGTYIRSLCHDIGEALGCGACMSELVRLRTGEFNIEETHTISEIEALYRQGRTNEFLIPVDKILSYKKVYTLPVCEKAVENGNIISFDQTSCDEEVAFGEKVNLYHPDGRFAGIFVRTELGYKLDKYFLE